MTFLEELQLKEKELEKRRMGYHEYIKTKLEERDYHAISDASADLRDLDREIFAIGQIASSYKRRMECDEG